MAARGSDPHARWLGASAMFEGGQLILSMPPLEPPALAVVSEPGADGARRYGTLVSELLAIELEPPKWIIPFYLQEENIAILAGPPGAGKTLQAFDWCAKLVQSGKTVFIAENEGGLPAFQSRLRRSCAAAGMAIPPDRYSYERNLQLDLTNFKQVRSFAKALEYTDVILLDSLGSFWPGLDENKAEHMSMAAEALKQLCEYSRASILCIHHTTKAAWKPGEKPGLGDIRGHGAMAGRIDAAYICKPLLCPAGVVRYELHVVKQRDGAWAQPQSVEVLMTGPEALVTMEPLQTRRSLSPEDQREAEVTRAVLSIMPVVESEAQSANALAARARKGKTEVLAAVKRLHRARLIEETSDGRFYVLKTTTHNPSDGSGPKASGNGSSDARKGFGFWGSVTKTGRNPGEDHE